MTEYSREDLIDAFLGSASRDDPPPTDAQYDAFLALSLLRFGAHPASVDTAACDQMVHEIVHPDDD